MPMENKWRQHRKKELFLIEQKAIKLWFDKLTLLLFTWNLSVLILIIFKSIESNSLRTWNINYGDFARTDIFYVIALNNFSNPYEYHPELPQISIVNYLPLPFMITKLLGLKVVETWDKLSIQPTLYIFFCMMLLSAIIYSSMKKYSFRSKVLYTITYGILTVPSLLIFSTGNIQAIITFAVFVGFFSLNKLTKTQSIKRFFSFVIIGSSKPHFLIANIIGYVDNKSIKLKEFILAFFATILLSIWGFAIFSGGLFNNLKYFYKSLFGFTSPNPNYLVHFNDSLIGNLLAIEAVINPASLQKSLVIQYQNLILMTYLLCTCIIAVSLLKNSAPKWLLIWIVGGLAAVLIPVSYAYNYTLFLIPLGLLLQDVSSENIQTSALFKSSVNRLLFGLALFLAFSPKYGYISLVPNVADTRVYSLFSSFSHMFVLIIGVNFLISRKTRIK